MVFSLNRSGQAPAIGQELTLDAHDPLIELVERGEGFTFLAAVFMAALQVVPRSFRGLAHLITRAATLELISPEHGRSLCARAVAQAEGFDDISVGIDKRDAGSIADHGVSKFERRPRDQRAEARLD